MKPIATRTRHLLASYTHWPVELSQFLSDWKPLTLIHPGLLFFFPFSCPNSIFRTIPFFYKRQAAFVNYLLLYLPPLSWAFRNWAFYWSILTPAHCTMSWSSAYFDLFLYPIRCSKPARRISLHTPLHYIWTALWREMTNWKQQTFSCIALNHQSYWTV